MIITEFHVDHFLGGNPLRLLDLGQGLNVALVDHRQSKLELLNLLPWVLFGQRLGRNRRRRHDSNRNLQSGGTVHVRTENGVFRVSRQPPELADPGHPALRISAPDGTIYDEGYLDNLLDGITIEQYRQQFTLTPGRLRRIAENKDGFAIDDICAIAKELVAQAPAVVTRVTFPEIDDSWLAGLDTSLEELRAQITQSMADDQAARDPSAEPSPAPAASAPKANSLELTQELKRTESLLTEVLAKDQHLEDEIEAIKGALNYNRAHTRLEEIQQELSKLRQESTSQTVDLTKNRPLIRLDARIKTCREKLQKVQLEGRELNHQLREDTTAARGLKSIPRIEAILFHERMYLAEEEAIDQLSGRIREFESRLESDRFQPKSAAPNRLASHRSDLPSVDELQRLARQAKQAKSEFERARSTLQDTENVARDTSFTSPQLGPAELRPLQDSERRVKRLRHQLDSHSQYHELESERQEVDGKVRRLYARQLMPFQMTMIFAVPFIVGVTMVIYNLWLADGEPNFGYVLLGFALALVTAILKLFLDHMGGDQLQTSRRRLASIENELTQITDGYDESELDNLVSRDSLVEKFRIAEEKVAALRNSLEDQQSSLPTPTAIDDLPEILSARQQLEEKQFSYRESMSTWRRFLVEAGMSPKLSPSQARIELAQLSSARSPIAQSFDFGNDLNLSHMRSDLDRRRHNLESLSDTVRNLLQDLGFSGSSRTIREQMDILREILEEKKAQLRQRRRLQRSLKKLAQRKKKIGSLQRRLSHHRGELVERLDKKQQQRNIKQQIHSQQVRMLQQEEEHMTAQIDELTNRYGEDERAPILGEMTDDQLESRLEHLRQQQGDIRDQLIGHAEKRGRFRERLKAWESSAPEIHSADYGTAVNWSEIEQKLGNVAHLRKLGKEQVTSWQRKLKRLGSSRSEPKYLALAAEYLVNLSGKKLIRFEYSSKKNTLGLRDKDGKVHALDSVAAEHIVDAYLGLWLARIDALADRGAKLPIVIDDLLETTGDKKDRRMAKALAACASRGHQFLSATFDVHHAREFAKLDVPIANLADRVRSVPNEPPTPELQSPALQNTVPQNTVPQRPAPKNTLPEPKRIDQAAGPWVAVPKDLRRVASSNGSGNRATEVERVDEP